MAIVQLGGRAFVPGKNNPDYEIKLNGTGIKSLDIVKSISLTLSVNNKASSFSFDVYNEGGEYTTYFSYHDDIEIYLGYEDTGTIGILHGRVEEVQKKFDSSGSILTVSGRNMWVALMEEYGVEQYTSTEYSNIIKDLVAKYATEITTTNVSSTGVTPDTENVDHAYLSEKITEYCNKNEFYAWVDFEDDLHFTNSPGSNTTVLTEGLNILSANLKIDYKKIRNHIRVYGKTVEGVQLLKTETDTTSIANYGLIKKPPIKNESLDSVGLVQSIVDAELLLAKEAEWGGIVWMCGDETVEPGKTIQLRNTSIGENNSAYRVMEVKHTYGSGGFVTTLTLQEEERKTAKFYKDLYEKNKQVLDFSNSGDYNESYVYKFTVDQDSLITFTNCYTSNSTLKVTDASSTATAELTTAIIGDANYAKCLPYVSQTYSDANKFYVSNDGGVSYEQVYHDTEHTFASSTGDKNDFKFKIEISAKPALEVASVGTDKIYGLDTDNSELWNFAVPDTAEEIWGLGFGAAKLWECENSTGKIYYCNPEDGTSETELADKDYELGGCTYHSSTTRLFAIDRTNAKVIEVNTSTGADDYTHALPVAIGDPTGITFDGTNFWIADKTDDKIYKMTTASTGDNVAWASSSSYLISEITDPYDLAWDGSNLRVVCDSDGKIHTLQFGTIVDQSQETNSSSAYFGNNIVIAQSFQPANSSDCSSIEIYLKRNASADDVTCILASDDGGEPGTILQSLTKTISSDTAHWEKFTWASVQALTIGTTYWVVLKSTTSDYNDYSVYYNSAGGYASGSAAIDLSDQFSEDFSTTTYKSDSTTAEWSNTYNKIKVWYKRTVNVNLNVPGDADFINAIEIGGMCRGKMWGNYGIIVGMTYSGRNCYRFGFDGSFSTDDHFNYDERSGVEISGIAWNGSNLFVLDKANKGVSKRNSSDENIEDAFYDISGTIDEPSGITWDGTYFWIGRMGFSVVYKFNASFVYQNDYFEQTFSGDFGWNGTYFVGKDAQSNGDVEIWSASSGLIGSIPFEEDPRAYWNPAGVDHEVDGERLWCIVISDNTKTLQTHDISDNAAISTVVSRGNNIQNISKATLTASDVTPSGTSIAYYLSADNGSNWESVTSGVEHNFSNTGTKLLWKAIISNPGEASGFAEISNISIDIMGGASEEFGFASEDIAFKVYLDDLLGSIASFTPPGGTPRGLTYKTEQGVSNVYTFGAYLK